MKMKKVVALFMTAALGMSMFAVPALAEEETEAATEVANTITGEVSDDSIVIWGWNDDIKNVVDKVIAESYPELYERIVFVNTGGSDNYQTKLDAILEDPSNELYPDIVGLEVDYVQKYVQSDWLLSIDDIGITSDDIANMYQYNVDLGTDYDGNVKALFWQATPGSFCVRADLAEKYLGTTDPEELAAYFTDLDTIVETARTVNEASGGATKLFNGADELKYVLMNSRTVGYYGDDDVITLDENIADYFNYSKTLFGEDLVFEAQGMWGNNWYAVMDGDGVESNAALAYCGCPWFVYWCLSDTWKANTILVESGIQFYWGGTGLAATSGAADTEAVGTIIKALTTDTEALQAINALNADYVNSTEAIAAIVESGASADGNGFVYSADQNFIEFYADKVDAIDASIVVAENQTINSMADDQQKAVATGEKDVETALADLKAAIHDTYPYLSVE